MSDHGRGPDTYSSDEKVYSEAGAFWAFGEAGNDQHEAPFSQAFFSREFSGFLSQEMPDLWALSSTASVGGMPLPPSGAQEGAPLQRSTIQPTTSSSPSPQEIAALLHASPPWVPAPHTSNRAPIPSAAASDFFTSPPSSYPGIAARPALSLSDSYEMQLQAQRMFPQAPGLSTAPAAPALPNWGGSTPSMGFKPLTESHPPPLQPQPQTSQPRAGGRKTAGGGPAKGRAGSSAAAPPLSKPGRKPTSGMEPPASLDGAKRVRGGDINKDKVLELEALLKEVGAVHKRSVLPSLPALPGGLFQFLLYPSICLSLHQQCDWIVRFSDIFYFSCEFVLDCHVPLGNSHQQQSASSFRN